MELRANWGEDVVPFTLMVIMEALTIALTILAKTALTGGMSPFVFVVYTNAVGSILLFPYSLWFHRERTDQPLFTFPLIVRCFLMGFTGIFMAQNLSFVGLGYSSPIVVCAMGLLLPAFSFLLSVTLGGTKLDWGSSTIQCKVIGTLVSFTGAIVEEAYKGLYIRPASSSPSRLLQHIPPFLVFYKTPDNWVLGCIFLAAASFSVSVWNIIQLGTVQKYPQVMKVVSFYSLAGTMQCAIFSLIMERDLDAWKLQLNLELLLIVATGIFASLIRTSVHVMCTRMKGPLYVPMFKPFGILFATIFGTSFFTNSLCYGSVLGAAVAGVGYYTVMWGQIREDEMKKGVEIERIDSSDDEQIKVPLLQEDMQV